MRKCCCCIAVHVGAAILGMIGVLFCCLELVVLVPYLLEIDVDTFNPIKDNLDQVFYILEQMLQDQGFEKEDIDRIVDNIKSYTWPTVVTLTVEAGIYGLFSLMMAIGAQFSVRSLMVPYLVVEMLAIVVTLFVGIAVTAALFFLNVIMGVVTGAVVFVVAFLMIYFWIAVQRAYVELGNRYHMYSPAPVKPIYNGNPTSPQLFQMDEQC